MGYDFELAGRSSLVHPIHGDPTATLSIDGVAVRAKLDPTGEPGEFTLEMDGRREIVHAAGRGDACFIHFRGRTWQVQAVDALRRAQRAAAPGGGSEALRAPMPGVVVEVATRVGAEVDAGDLLMTIESMKLQTAIVAPHAGLVAEVCLEAGAQFEQGALLVRLDAPNEDGGES